MRISQEQGENTNGSYGSVSSTKHTWDREDIVRGGKLLDTIDMRTTMCGNHFGSYLRRRYLSHHHHHRYRKGEYFP